MKKIITLLGCILFTVNTTVSSAPAIEVVTTHTPTPRELVGIKSKEYGVSESVMINIINCENREWDTNLQSRIISNGTREDSWGPFTS
jgi:hypothetical protein